MDALREHTKINLLFKVQTLIRLLLKKTSLNFFLISCYLYDCKELLNCFELLCMKVDSIKTVVKKISNLNKDIKKLIHMHFNAIS